MKVSILRIKDKYGYIYLKNEVFLEKDKGIQDDINAKGGDKQVSILRLDSREKIDTGNFQGLCTSRFYENISIEGLKVDRFKKGDKIKLGNSIIEITSTEKRCFGECPLYQNNIKCPLVGNTIFAKVIKSGKVKLKDKVTPLEKI